MTHSSLRLSILPVLAILVALMASNPAQAQALDDAWFVGFGGGQALLEPNPVDPTITLDDDADEPTGGSIFIGRDAGNFSSVQLQLYSFGSAELSNDETIDYQALEGAVLYRFYDSRDRSLRRGGMHLALYGRVGVGILDREIGTELELVLDSDFYFGAGFGAEWFFLGPLSLRAEYTYLDRDIQVAQIALAYRFGGTGGGGIPQPSSPVGGSSPVTGSPDTGGFTPPPTDITVVEPPPSTEIGEVELIPETTAEAPAQPTFRSDIANDSDADGVPNSIDQCSDSRSNYPVRENGCSLFNGVLSGVSFEGRTATLSPASFAQLDFLAGVLLQFPEARIQLLAHTDSIGNRLDQANVTRSRLRVVGSYLVRKGVSAKRMVLRSLGGEMPLHSNDTESGRIANNRIEVLEQP